MTVTLILVVALMKIFAATANTWQHGEAQVDAYREARGALQLMARDLSATLQSASVPVPTPTPAATGSAATPTTGPLLPTLLLQRASGTADTTGPNNEEVYCLTNIPNTGSSTLCAVGYYCQWMPLLSSSSNAPKAYALMRQSLDSNGTFLRLKSVAQGTPATFVNLFSQAGTPSASVTQLAAYVWDLRFRIDTDLNENDIPDGNGTGVPKDHTQPMARVYQDSGGLTPYPNYLPSYIEIRFKALSATASRRLEGNGAVSQQTWHDAGASGSTNSTVYQTIIRPNLQQFILRVPFIDATPQPSPTP